MTKSSQNHARESWDTSNVISKMKPDSKLITGIIACKTFSKLLLERFLCNINLAFDDPPPGSNGLVARPLSVSTPFE